MIDHLKTTFLCMFAVLLAGCGEEPGNKKPIKYSPTQKAGRVECVNLEINEWFDIEQYGKTIPVDHDEVRIKRGDFSVISKKPGVRPSLFSSIRKGDLEVFKNDDSIITPHGSAMANLKNNLFINSPIVSYHGWSPGFETKWGSVFSTETRRYYKELAAKYEKEPTILMCGRDYGNFLNKGKPLKYCIETIDGRDIKETGHKQIYLVLFADSAAEKDRFFKLTPFPLTVEFID